MIVMKSPLRATAAAVLLIAGFGVTACSSAGSATSAAPATSAASAPVDQGRTVVAFTPDQPLNDGQLHQAADQIRRRAEQVGLKDPQVTVGSGTVSLSAAGAVGDRAAALGHQPVLEFRPVIAEAIQATLSPQGSPPTLGTVPAELRQQFYALKCTAPVTGTRPTDPGADAVACDGATGPGLRYVFALGPVAVKQAEISASSASQDPQSGADDWAVLLRFDAKGSAAFTTFTGQLAIQATPANQCAVVLDGTVVSHPFLKQAVTAGAAEISGAFTEDQARTLAAQLSTGSLPAEFHAGTPARSPAS